MSLWDNILKKWAEQDVPNITLLKFEIGIHFSNCPWFCLKDNYQNTQSGNPLDQTAFHLCCFLQDKPIELVAAYKIYAALKYYSEDWLWNQPLSEAMAKHGENLYGWWNHNAKNILPYTTNCNNYFRNGIKNINEQEDLTIQSANLWKDISREWAIIKIPTYLNKDSNEYNEYHAFSKKEADEREYQQYLRLKNKFEKQCTAYNSAFAKPGRTNKFLQLKSISQLWFYGLTALM